MDRALVFGTRDGGSIPSGRTLGLLAQLVEQSPLKRSVAGSSPVQPTKIRRSVGTGRRARLRTVYRKVWRFDSSLRHI